MVDETRQERRVRIQTVCGVIEGSLRIGSRLRTLDDLNVVSKCFVRISEAVSTEPGWTVGEGMLAVNKARILFVQELTSTTTRPASEFGRFTRGAMRLRVGEFDVQGFVHSPPGGAPLKRLDQSNHPFVALTSVLVEGPDTQFSTPFLAVNRNHIIAAQEIAPVEGETVSSTSLGVEG